MLQELKELHKQLSTYMTKYADELIEADAYGDVSDAENSLNYAIDTLEAP